MIYLNYLMSVLAFYCLQTTQANNFQKCGVNIGGSPIASQQSCDILCNCNWSERSLVPLSTRQFVR